MSSGDKLPESTPPVVPSTETPLRGMMVSSVSTSFSGPIPSPQVLAEYERILPGSAERILQMAEQQAAHRQEMERQITAADIEDQRAMRAETKRGQILGMISVLACLGVSTMAVAYNQPWVAGIIGGGTLVGLAGAYFYRSEEPSKE